jgi:hypothetical protein
MKNTVVWDVTPEEHASSILFPEDGGGMILINAGEHLIRLYGVARAKTSSVS